MRPELLLHILASSVKNSFPDHNIMYYKGLLQSQGVLMTLTKADIAQKIANDAGFMKHEAAEIVEKLLDIMKNRLTSGEDVMISGFGKWNVKSKHARRGRNPKTGEQIVLDARRVVTWSYSPVLKKAVNESKR
jgi:integration host factor subunit alpha